MSFWDFSSNPIEEQDSKIKLLQESLTKANESVKDKDELIASLEQKQKEEVARWKDKLSTAQKKVNSVYSGSARKLLKDVTDVSTPIVTEDFDNTCRLLAVSFYDTNLNEEDVEMMNSESAPEELKNDVFKPFRDQVDLTDSDQAERFGRVRNKVVENLKTTIRSRSRSLGSGSPASKRGNSEGDQSDGKPLSWLITAPLLIRTRTSSLSLASLRRKNNNSYKCRPLSINLSKLVI